MHRASHTESHRCSPDVSDKVGCHSCEWQCLLAAGLWPALLVVQGALENAAGRQYREEMLRKVWLLPSRPDSPTELCPRWLLSRPWWRDDHKLSSCLSNTRLAQSSWLSSVRPFGRVWVAVSTRCSPHKRRVLQSARASRGCHPPNHEFHLAGISSIRENTPAC